MMIKKIFSYLLWVVGIVFVIAVVMSSGIMDSFFEQRPTTKVSTSVTSLEKVNQITFLNVGIQKVVTSTETTKVLFTDLDIPYSEKEVSIILNYKAKFGIKKHVTVKELKKSRFKVIILKFEVIGFELDKDKPYQLYSSSKGLLSDSTKDVDTGKLVTDSLSNKEQEEYLNQYKDLARESAKEYYKKVLTSFNKDAKVECEFEE